MQSMTSSMARRSEDDLNTVTTSEGKNGGDGASQEQTLE